FDGDNDFGATTEGPYRLGDRFDCLAGVTGCDGDAYELGPFNTTLRMYDAAYADRLAAQNPDMAIGRRTVSFTYDTVNPSFQSLIPFDAAIARNWTESDLSNYNDTLTEFIAAEKFLVVHAQVDRTAIDNTGNFLGRLGFDYIQQYSLEGGGSTTNVLYTVHDASTRSY
ncbi:MAG: hypothetical protein ABEK12_02200, partial [Candidatus Nanohaloarchaea archaeon]